MVQQSEYRGANFRHSCSTPKRIRTIRRRGLVRLSGSKGTDRPVTAAPTAATRILRCSRPARGLSACTADFSKSDISKFDVSQPDVSKSKDREGTSSFFSRRRYQRVQSPCRRTGSEPARSPKRSKRIHANYFCQTRGPSGLLKTSFAKFAGVSGLSHAFAAGASGDRATADAARASHA